MPGRSVLKFALAQKSAIARWDDKAKRRQYVSAEIFHRPDDGLGREFFEIK
jgi:hypothetical protein